MKLYYDDSKKLEIVFRDMWRSIFEDPQAYEDFYFQTMYPQNRVLAAEVKDEIAGMIHLNPYQLYVNGSLHNLHYIVGVATLKSFRRQGIMRQMLVKCMQDMADAGEIFTYLMPANKDYYEPFDFAFIEQFQTIKLNGIQGESAIRVLKDEEFSQVANDLCVYLENKYQVFTKIDSRYLAQLKKECLAEDGELLVYKKKGRLQGFCCYSQDETGVFLRQIFAEEPQVMIEELQKYFGNVSMEFVLDGKGKCDGDMIMARILRFDLLFPLLKGKQEYEFVIHIEDSYLEQQNGNFKITVHPEGCRICRTETDADRSIAIWDLTKILFGFDCAKLLKQYPDFQSINPISPVMIGEII